MSACCARGLLPRGRAWLVAQRAAAAPGAAACVQTGLMRGRPLNLTSISGPSCHLRDTPTLLPMALAPRPPRPVERSNTPCLQTAMKLMPSVRALTWSRLLAASTGPDRLPPFCPSTMRLGSTGGWAVNNTTARSANASRFSGGKLGIDSSLMKACSVDAAPSGSCQEATGEAPAAGRSAGGKLPGSYGRGTSSGVQCHAASCWSRRRKLAGRPHPHASRLPQPTLEACP